MHKHLDLSIWVHPWESVANQFPHSVTALATHANNGGAYMLLATKLAYTFLIGGLTRHRTNVAQSVPFRQWLRST